MAATALSRRAFFTQAVAGAALIAGGARGLVAQGQAAPSGSGSPNAAPQMDQDAAETVRRPPKPGASPSMTADERDRLEHRIRCQCGCTLDVYTCRTTDFSCQVSPAMHRDVQSLVAGGYDAQEILDAFVETYGERALMSPKKEGFNWVGYIMPFAALGAGLVVVTALIVRWQRAARIAAAAPVPSRGLAPLPLEATPEELSRLASAVRNEEP